MKNIACLKCLHLSELVLFLKYDIHGLIFFELINQVLKILGFS